MIRYYLVILSAILIACNSSTEHNTSPEGSAEVDCGLVNLDSTVRANVNLYSNEFLGDSNSKGVVILLVVNSTEFFLSAGLNKSTIDSYGIQMITIVNEKPVLIVSELQNILQSSKGNTDLLEPFLHNDTHRIAASFTPPVWKGSFEEDRWVVVHELKEEDYNRFIEFVDALP